MRISIFPLIIKLVDLILDLLNYIYYLYAKLFYPNYNLPLKLKTKNKILVVLNGPSLKKQKITNKHSTEYDMVFVNRGFIHKEYAKIKPLFHVIIDSKLINGEWPISWINDIIILNPNVNFIFPVHWKKYPIINNLIKKNINIHWLKTKKQFSSLGVAGACIEWSILLGYKEIILTGFDGNGIAYELINEKSHFYGVNSENNKKTLKDYSLDLFSHSRFFRSLIKLNIECKRKKIKIYNATIGGVISVFDSIKI